MPHLQRPGPPPRHQALVVAGLDLVGKFYQSIMLREGGGGRERVEEGRRDGGGSEEEVYI